MINTTLELINPMGNATIELMRAEIELINTTTELTHATIEFINTAIELINDEHCIDRPNVRQYTYAACVG